MADGTIMDSVSLPVSTVVSRGVLSALLPFVTCSSGYFYSHLFLEQSAEMRALLKMIPIFFLVLYCLIYGHSESARKYFVAAGLLASSIGDYYLVWRDDENFLRGMIAFAVAHQLYILAFGFRLNSPIPLLFSTVLGTSATTFLLPHLEGILAYGVPCYIVLISVMFWRALARLQPSFTWTEGVGALGAFIFAVSDFNLALNAFYFKVPYKGHHLVTMITYYIGQLCIALSAVDREYTARTSMRKLD